MNRVALPLFALLCAAQSSHAQIATAPPTAADRAFASKLRAGLAETGDALAKTNAGQALAVRVELRVSGSGVTDKGYVLTRERGRIVLSNGDRYDRRIHGRLKQRPRGDHMIGEGSRFVLGENTVDRIEFSSRVEAMNFVFAMKSTNVPLAHEVRGTSVLSVWGPMAADAEDFAALRALLEEPGQPPVDALLATHHKSAIATGRFKSPFRLHYMDASRLMRKAGKDVGPENQPDPERVTFRHARSRPNGVLEVRHGPGKEQPVLDAFSRSFREQHDRDLPARRAARARAGLSARVEATSTKGVRGLVPRPIVAEDKPGSRKPDAHQSGFRQSLKRARERKAVRG